MIFRHFIHENLVVVWGGGGKEFTSLPTTSRIYLFTVRDDHLRTPPPRAEKSTSVLLCFPLTYLSLLFCTYDPPTPLLLTVVHCGLPSALFFCIITPLPFFSNP